MSSLPIGTKPGRPVDPMLALYRSLFPEWSARTIARYALAMRRLDTLGFDLDAQHAVLRRAVRHNGTINVSRLDEITESMAALWISDHCHAEAA